MGFNVYKLICVDDGNADKLGLELGAKLGFKDALGLDDGSSLGHSPLGSNRNVVSMASNII